MVCYVTLWYVMLCCGMLCYGMVCVPGLVWCSWSRGQVRVRVQVQVQVRVRVGLRLQTTVYTSREERMEVRRGVELR